MKKTQMDQEIELSDFFHSLGAFTTDYFSQKMILGWGGEIIKTSTLPKENCFFLKDFFEDEYLVYLPETIAEFDLNHLRTFYTNSESLEVSCLKTLDQSYEADFNFLQKRLGENLKKVVLLSRAEFTIQKNQTELRKFLFSKCLNFNSGSPYGFWNNEYGLIGNTPEYLYAINDSKFFTLALAGSAKKGEEEKLLASQKDRKEHDFVIFDIIEKCKLLGLEACVEKTEIASFKSMIHLKTPITARLPSDWSHEKLIKVLSPTAALGGYPTLEAMNFLKETEYQKENPKRYFGSAFGYKSEKINQVLVAIRNVQWNPLKLWIESGGGVVSGSELENELNEVRLKRNIIKDHYLCESP